MFLFLLLTLFSCSNMKTAVQNADKGFVEIFDGKTLNGWQGDPVYWRVENGSLVGEVKPETILKRNTFIIWRNGITTDFELKVDYRITAGGNSGINYRSEVDDMPFALKGYQGDIDGANKYTGQNYEERGRTFLALRGQQVLLKNNEKPIVTAQIGNVDSLKKHITPAWNQYHIIARGNRLQHFLNGVLMSDVTDEDSEKRKMSGLLGVQVHVGPPMKIEYRNIRIKQLNRP